MRAEANTVGRGFPSVISSDSPRRLRAGIRGRGDGRDNQYYAGYYAATHLLVAQLMNSAVKKGGLTDCSGDVPWHVRFESRRAADVATPLDETSAQDPLIASVRTCATTEKSVGN